MDQVKIFDESFSSNLIKNLNFSLTNDQMKSINDINEDVGYKVPTSIDVIETKD